MGNFRKDSHLSRFSQHLSTAPKRSVRTIIVKAKAQQEQPKTPGKRGRKPLPEGEIRVVKYVKLSAEHLQVLNSIKVQLRTHSTSKAIKHCIEEFGRSCRNDSEIPQAGS
jgi:hypothetical protein